MDNCNQKIKANVKNGLHTRSASKNREKNCLRKAKKIIERNRSKPYRIAEYLTSEYSKHLEGVLCPNTQSQGNMNDTRQEKDDEFNLLQRQNHSSCFCSFTKVPSSNQQQDTKSCSCLNVINEVHQIDRYRNLYDNHSKLSAQISQNQYYNQQNPFAHPDESQKYSDCNVSYLMPQHYYPAIHHQMRRHQQSHHQRQHHQDQHQHYQYQYQQQLQQQQQRLQLKPESLHNHTKHPSLYNIYNHDIHKTEDTSTSCHSYKHRNKEHDSSNKPYQFPSSDMHKDSLDNSYQGQDLQRSLPETHEPYNNNSSNYNEKIYEPAESLVKGHRTTLVKGTEPINMSLPCVQNKIDAAELYGNLLEAGLISSQPVSEMLAPESCEELKLDSKTESTTEQKDDSLLKQQCSIQRNWENYKAENNNGLKIGQNTQVMYTSESAAKMENVLPILNNMCLIRFPMSLIEKLYDGKQCSTCGERSSIIDTEHMDKHFRQNELRTDKKFLKCRNWYEDEITNPEEQQERCSKDPQLEVKQDVKKTQFIPAVTDVCSVCKENFRQFYNQEAEEWQLKDAVIIDNQYFHEICSEDRNNI